MSEAQLSAFVAALTGNEELREVFKGATDLDAALTIANDAGFDVSKEDFVSHLSQKTFSMELCEEDLEAVAGGCGPYSQMGGEGLHCIVFGTKDTYSECN